MIKTKNVAYFYLLFGNFMHIKIYFDYIYPQPPSNPPKHPQYISPLVIFFLLL